MSLIYRSLKEIQGAKGTPNQGPRPALPRRDVVRVALHTVIGLVVCAIAGTLVWLAVQNRADQLAPAPRPPVRPAAPPPEAARPDLTAPAAQAPPPGPGAPAPAPASSPAAPADPLAQSVDDLARSLTSGVPAAPDKDAPRPPKDPDKAQAEHFQAQARRNQKIFDLERRLSVSWRWDDLGMFRQDLSSLRQILGPGSELAGKWEGVEAMADKNFVRAEVLFRKTLERNPGDLAGRLNLVLALSGQNRTQEARREFVRLERQFPLDPRVREMGRLLDRSEAAARAQAPAKATVPGAAGGAGPAAEPGVNAPSLDGTAPGAGQPAAADPVRLTGPGPERIPADAGAVSAGNP